MNKQLYSNKWSRYLLALLLAISGITCIDPFDPDLPDTEQKLTVDAQLTTLPGPQLVRLRYSGTFENNSGVPAVSGANVYVSDDQGNRYDFEGEGGTGIYRSDPGFSGVVGRTYTLFIELAGKKFQSQPEPLQPAVPMDTAYAEFVTEENDLGVSRRFFKTYAEVTDPVGAGNYYMFRWAHYEELEYCFGRVDGETKVNQVNLCCDRPCWKFDFCPSCYQLRSDRFSNGNQSKVFLTDIPYDSEAPYYMRMELWSINASAYNFLKTGATQIQNTGGIFDKAPAPIQGNLFNPADPEEQVLGIFVVAGVHLQGSWLSRAGGSGQPIPPVTLPVSIQRGCKPCGTSFNQTGVMPPDWQ